MLGWIAVSWDDAELNFEHLRPMGHEPQNWWTGRVRHGVGQWFMGDRAGVHAGQRPVPHGKPPVLAWAGTANLWGYVRSAAQRKPRYGDAAFRKFLTRYQWDLPRARQGEGDGPT